MQKIIFYTLSAAIITSCSSNTNNSATPGEENNTDTLAPVETKDANTNYKPAFEGQTRIAGVKTQTAFEGSSISSDLKKPWGITNLPDGRLLITQKGGTLRIATTSGQLGNDITGLPEVNSNGQGGLLDVLVDPNFATNRLLYWTFSENISGGTLTSVAKGNLSADETKVENAQVIYRATPAYNGTLHYGSRILMDKSGNLVFSTGERSDLATRPLAQSLDAGMGKVMRITTDGKPAAGNPFLNQANARPEIYSYGHRNVQGLAFHPETGDLWENEFGPRGGDELNRIEPGKNYGWPTITYGLEYSGTAISGGQTQKEGFEQPVYYWDPVLSPSGMTFNSGKSIAEWKNNLFICGLNSMHIARLVITNNKVTGEERILANEKERFRDITEGLDGNMYAVTDGGKLYKIAKK